MSLVDRATKYALLGGQKDTVGMIRLLGSGALLVHTITSDNGKEFADHRRVALDADFFFAFPFPGARLE